MCLVNTANKVAGESRVRHRKISQKSTVPEIADWLSSVDRNGCFQGPCMKAEGFDPLTKRTAWDLVRDILVDELPENCRK